MTESIWARGVGCKFHEEPFLWFLLFRALHHKLKTRVLLIIQLHFPNGTRKYRASDSFLMRFNPFSAETAMTNTDEEHKLGTLPTVRQ
jgi:hypothetical protein